MPKDRSKRDAAGRLTGIDGTPPTAATSPQAPEDPGSAADNTASVDEPHNRSDQSTGVPYLDNDQERGQWLDGMWVPENELSSLSRRKRLRARGPYRSFIPDPITGWLPTIPGELAGQLADAWHLDAADFVRLAP